MSASFSDGRDPRGFGLGAYAVPDADELVATAGDDFDNPSSALGQLPPAERARARWDAFRDAPDTPEELEEYRADFERRVRAKVEAAAEFDGIEYHTREFATFCGLGNAVYLAGALKRLCGYHPDADDLWEKMLYVFGQQYSRAADPTDERREDDSDGAVLEYVRGLNQRVLEELSYELPVNHELRRTYARNLNGRYGGRGAYSRPKVVTTKDDGFYVGGFGDVLMP